jgi:4-amino-4-deoxy-L-arabinose transferase-like glycosyltransferase
MYLFSSSVDKPLYISFLAFGNLIAGSAYERLIIFQILFMAVIPVFLYLTGKELFGRSLGFLAAVLGVLREYTGIIGTNIIQVTNSKMLMTELPATLGVLVICYCMIRFLKDPHRLFWIIMTGGAIGLTCLVRLNAVLVMPFFVVLIGLAYRFRVKKWFPICLLFSFMVVIPLIPWAVRNQIFYNNPFISITSKTTGVLLEKRYLPALNNDSGQPGKQESPPVQTDFQVQPTQSNTLLIPPASIQPPLFVGYQKYFSLFKDMFHHFAHNGATTVMMLPASPWLRNFYQTVRTPYWDINWDGNLLPGGGLVLFMTFFLISIGINALWVRSETAALVPAAGYFGYLLSTSLSVTSGGRYIQPVDWVLPFYYCAGLATLATYGLKLTRLHKEMEKPIFPPTYPEEISFRPAFSLLIMTAFLLAGAVIPLSEYALTILRTAQSSATFTLQGYSQLAKEAGIDPQELDSFLISSHAVARYGQALYPRLYQTGETEIADRFPMAQSRLVFTLLDNKNDQWVVTPIENPLDNFYHEEETLVVGCLKGDDYIEGRVVIQQHMGQVLTVYSPSGLTPCPSP